MDFYLISVLIFVAILAVLVYKDRKKFERQSILLLRKTQRGKKFLIKTGTGHPRFWKVVGVIGVLAGFLVSVWIFYELAAITARNLTTTEVVQGAGFLLPSPFSTASAGPGYFAVPFWYWIIAIGLLVVVHEGLHGIMAAREKIRIKSLGLGLLLVIPLAFVEPDEKQLAKKPAWSQLRVLAAGSFSNFMLAGLSILLLAILGAALFAPSGVAFQGYPAQRIGASEIIGINNQPLAGDLKSTLLLMENDSFIQVNTANMTFLSKPGILLKQMNVSDRLIVYEEWPAVENNLSGVIISVDGSTVNDHVDLRRALEAAGPDNDATVVTTNGTDNRTFVLHTQVEPEPKFIPDANTYTVLAFEQYLPGTVDFTEAVSGWWASVRGLRAEKNWGTLELDISFWKWVKDNYPSLAAEADNKTQSLQAELQNYPRAGFIGIAGISVNFALKPGLAYWTEAINFTNGLLFWLFLINFGVGAFNLLPIRGLDGGRMWEIVFQKISKKRSKSIINFFSYLTLAIILLNFLFVFGIRF